jgi:hypothetical protein
VPNADIEQFGSELGSSGDSVRSLAEQNIFDLPQRQRIYIITVRRMTWGELLKYRKGLSIAGG